MKHGCITTLLSQNNNQNKRQGSLPPKKAKALLSAKKVMASVFWDCKGVIMVDYLTKGETINSASYCTLLRRLREEIKSKRHGMLSKKSAASSRQRACPHV